MARRLRPAEEHENHERWLVSYADFVTLLFAFFVTMYALSSVNEGKYRVLSDSLVQAFRNVPASPLEPKFVAPPRALPIPLAVKPRPNAKAQEQRRAVRTRMRSMARDISTVMAPLVRDGQVRVTETARGVTVEINASVLFDPGDARLDPRAVTALRAVAHILAPTDFPVAVEGHTDNAPISTSQFPSNWELSAVRASSVVRLFVDAGVAPPRLTASGYGEQRPVADNDIPENRARNRRVSILIDSPNQDAPEEMPVVPPGATTKEVGLPRNGSSG